MKRFLILKLLAINLVVIAFVMVIVWLAIDTLAAGYFVTLMEKYHISPEPAHEMFVGAVHRYLLWASLGAAGLAAGLSFLLMRRVLAPLTRMTGITREIAAGNFSVRVPSGDPDEVGQLAEAFNRMAESLLAMEKLRRTLMIDVAHELRTPLTNIRGYLEALTDGVIPPTKQTFALLQEETLRLVQLVEDVLQLARADRARGSLHCEPVDLKAAVEDTLAPFARAFGGRSITVRRHFPQGPAVASVDRDRIARVLRNLADNATRYTPENGTLDIRIVTGDDAVTIDYTNDGGELTPEDLPNIFERFYRGEKSRSREHGGAGIGLSIVKELVVAHGGTVGAELRKGRISIRVTLPMGEATPLGVK